MLKSEPNWMVLTGGADGTEMQKDMVRVALSSRDFSILQGPPGSGKSTTILEIVLQKIISGENVLLGGSTQASIDNVLLRIKENGSLKKLISPLRIGRVEGIYDPGVHDYVLSEQMEKMMPDSGMIREVKYQYADMSRGGDGGELGFPDRTVTCRSHNYKDYPDSFFQEVCDLMGWDR